MKINKSHFWYNKSQRNGILFLVVIIVTLQAVISINLFSENKLIDTRSQELTAYQRQIDSLKLIEIENRKPKIYPFNPNFITDYKGEQLGMSLREIDRLLAYRNANKFVNSKEEFQQVTQVSDSLLNEIAPYFRFPDWVVKRNQNKTNKNEGLSFSRKWESKKKKTKHQLTTTDINKATAEDLKNINGIGEAFSKRIIKYRSKLQGFSINEQLYEVWGLEKEVADRVLSVFKIQEKPIIKKVNVNTITFKELLKNPYINYELCKKIFNYRDEVAELQNISELKNIKDFPVELYDRIVLYLQAK